LYWSSIALAMGSGRAAALAPAEEAYRAQYNLGALLLGRGKYREAESVLSIVEDLLFKLELE
ncbi:hypothetical protein, partial [Stenotrophomonas maltophilia]|uniref:hypothetical protein n=1 Tax=Stenotrophomonas maltophilia TaxID=40324 RepID=UPI0019548C7B